MPEINHKTTIIELKDVSFAYEKEAVVKDVSLVVHKGDYVGIIGPNGGGKSTLLKLILGLLTPTKGEILLFGKPIIKFKDWPRFGYISQVVTHTDPHFPMTVKEVVTMGRYPRLGLMRFPTKEDKFKVQKALEQVEMWEFRDRLIGDLSGGQKQRVFIARALAGEPEIIVLDEPTAGVDVKTQKQFYTLLQKLNKELELTLILVSHELDIIEHEATEIAYINGSLVYYGLADQFVHSEYFEKLTEKGDHHV
jgi:zinc transport system ATP-binding protein